jgi:hypothetical protein
MSADDENPDVSELMAERYGSPPVARDLGDVDAVLVQLIQIEEAAKPLQGSDAIAVRAIVALSRAGADNLTEAASAGSRDVARLSSRGRAQLDEARRLVAELSRQRDAAARRPR